MSSLYPLYFISIFNFTCYVIFSLNYVPFVPLLFRRDVGDYHLRKRIFTKHLFPRHPLLQRSTAQIASVALAFKRFKTYDDASRAFLTWTIPFINHIFTVSFLFLFFCVLLLLSMLWLVGCIRRLCLTEAKLFIVVVELLLFRTSKPLTFSELLDLSNTETN